MAKSNIVPFLKWAGGKRWFTASYAEFFPKQFNHYYEPFLGGGAVFFHLKPTHATLSDRNSELVNLYVQIRDNWKAIESLLQNHHENHNKCYYYELRDVVLGNDAERAALFLYMNRTCWNGLYRVNKNGKFNVPIGTKTNVVLDTDNFQDVAKALKGKTIIKSDFEEQINNAKCDDFVFADPPYTVKHNHNNFVKYNEQIFSWSDQIRLRDAVTRARERGVKVLLTNAAHKSVEDLYQGNSHVTRVQRSSILAADPGARQKVEELLVRTWL